LSEKSMYKMYLVWDVITTK